MTKLIAVFALVLTTWLGLPRFQTEDAQQQEQATSSYTLINRALSAGQIDTETAHKYRVFAAFGDRRLPPRFRGDNAGITELPRSVLDVDRLLPTLSAQTQAELRPFFLPPGDPASWVNLSTVANEAQPGPPENDDDAAAHGPTAEALSLGTAVQWDTFSAAGGKVKIWAQSRRPGDVAKAKVLAAQMTAKIWPKLVGLFWEPLSDINFPRNSGGPALDVFLVRPGFTDQDAAYNRANYGTADAWNGIAMYADPQKCPEAAYFILLDSKQPLGSETEPGMLQYLAHELTHAITGRKPLLKDCREYSWATEATAEWAEHFVYPGAQSEHPAASTFMRKVHLPLTEDPGTGEAFGYDGYLFPFYLELNGRVRAIPTMWERFGTHDLLNGIDAALKGAGPDLRTTFPLFTLHNLNQGSVDQYLKRDTLYSKAEIAHEHEISLAASSETSREITIPLGIPYLASKYAYFKFDQSVRTITFDNPLTPLQHASVWIVPRVLGTWEAPIDLSRVPAKTWCRDEPFDVEELFIVFTNNGWKDLARTVDSRPDLPKVTAHRVGCMGWVGTSESVTTITAKDPNWKIVETISTNIQFNANRELNTPGQPREYWKALNGTIRWHVQVTGECSGVAEGELGIPDIPDDPAATLRIWEEDGKLRHMGTNGPWPGDIPRYKVTCREGTGELVLHSALGWFVTDGDKDEMDPDGKSFSGDFLGGFPPDIVVRHTYRFRCAFGC